MCAPRMRKAVRSSKTRTLLQQKMFAVGAVQAVCRASRRFIVEFEQQVRSAYFRADAHASGCSAGRVAIVGFSKLSVAWRSGFERKFEPRLLK